MPQARKKNLSQQLYIEGSAAVSVTMAGTIVQHIGGKALETPRQLTPYAAIDPESDCIGRADDLRRLSDAIRRSTKVVVVNGLGGIGKTTLAKAWFQSALAGYDHFAWVSVVADSGDGFGFVETIALHPTLHANLHLSFGDKEPIGARFAAVMNALRRLEGKNLLVVDNAGPELEQEHIRAQLPQPPHWQVLITSRRQLHGYEPLRLDQLSPDHAAELFRRHYTGPCTADELNGLLQELDCHTLTVELMAKTLQEHLGTLSVSELLGKLKRRELADPELQRRIRLQHSPKETEVYLHLLATFDVAGLSGAEQLLLARLAALPPGGLYSAAQLEDWLRCAPEQRRELHETLVGLERKGWIVRGQAQRFALHRMVRQALLYQLKPGLEALSVLVETFTEKTHFDVSTDFTRLFEWGAYGEQLLQVLPEAVHGDGGVGLLKNNLGALFQQLGDYEKARDLLESALASAKTNFGPHHPNVAVRQSNLATVYRNLGDYEKARDLLESALASDLTNFGPHHPNVAVRCNNLAHVCLGLKDDAKALELFEQALQILIACFGERHPHVAIVRASIFGLKGERGDS